MARKKLTKAQIAARTEKAKATREANKKAALAAMGIEERPKKTRKKRKKMTEEQRKAAAERLAKARESRGPSKNLQIAEEVRLLPDEHPLSLKNVRSWIKENKELLKSMRGLKESKVAKERAHYQSVSVYIQNLESYLRNGVYTDNKYGAEQQNDIKYVVKKMAYYKDGTPKRTVGFVYPDVGLYTQEMKEEDARP